MNITQVQTSFPFKVSTPTSWKETVLISAVALAALSGFVQILVGTYSSMLVYSFLATAAYLGYLAQKNVMESKRREEYLLDLQKNTQSLRKERIGFQEENKSLAQTNQELKQQVESLTQKLKSMENLLVKIDESAVLTKDLLSSCIDVSKGQKQTESRIQDLLTKLEKGNFSQTQKEIENHVKRLSQTIHSMEKEIKQFFLEDSKGTRLLEIKKEFVQTNQDLQKVKMELERVQKELSETSARLEKTSFDLESKLARLNEKESKLSHLMNLTPLVLKFLKKPELHQQLSLKEEEMLNLVQKNWQSLSSSP